MSSSRLGLHARELLSVRVVTGPATAIPISTSRPSFRARGLPWTSSFTTSQPRPMLPRKGDDYIPRVEERNAPSISTAKQVKESGVNEALAVAISIVLPGTFILPPLSQFPKPLGQKFRLLWDCVVAKTQEMVLNSISRFSSKPSVFKRATIQYKKSSLIPTAKALHRSMLEGLASGDRLVINKTCARKFAATLLTNIDSRPQGRRYSWELVKYTNRLFYPSIKSHKLSPIGREAGAPIIRQLVVAISSKQRKGVYDAQGRVIPGSEKEMDVVENVALAAVIDPKNGYKQSEWRIIGTIKPTTMESWLQDKKIMESVIRSS